MGENQKRLKKNAKRTLKKHYGLFVITMLIAVVLGTVSSGAADILALRYDLSQRSASARVLEAAIDGNISDAVDIASQNMLAQEDRDVKIGDVQFGHKKGILAEVFNKRASGSFIASFASVIFNFASSPTVASIILMIIALIVIGLESIFVSQVYRVVYTRVFLEASNYKKVNFSAFLFLLRTKKWKQVSLAYLRYGVVGVLWWFTIIGGIIKHYSYYMTRFILAENPNLSGKEAMNLSENMMRGHKWDMFKLDVSFIGWHILSLLTGRLLDIFFLIPYKEAVYTEYYIYIRSEAINNEIANVEQLYDRYLYEVAENQTINRAYADAIEVMNSPEIELSQPSKIRAILQNVFGIVFRYDSLEEEYRQVMSKKAHVGSYLSVVRGEAYPIRLCPTKIEEGRDHMEHVQYMRHYSISSLILIFFTFCFVGWIWEVSIHLVNDGVFVNRGALHGPWLPIYGTGAVMILAVLNKLRRKPIVEFISAIALCGVVEYTGSYALEKVHGQKWWDYSDYFLNVNGRICAEGLLVFGIAGVAAVYFLAPILDNEFRRINNVVRRVLCIALSVLFVIDFAYSQIHPNVGAGITDYGNTSATIVEYQNEVSCV